MNNEDQKIKDLLNAYTKTPPSEAFVQNVMRRVRQDQPVSLLSRWLTFPRLAFAGAAIAAAVFMAIPHKQPPVVVAADDTPTIIYTASLLENTVDDIVPADSETEALIETYFL